jgi:hypothetical protein
MIEHEAQNSHSRAHRVSNADAGTASALLLAHQKARMTRSKARAFAVEILIAYSHSAQDADLRLCYTMALTSPVRAARPSAQRPWSLRERLDEREITELITTYRNGAAASLATAHGVSPSSVKRLLHTAGVRRTPSIRGSEKTTPTTTYP